MEEGEASGTKDVEEDEASGTKVEKRASYIVNKNIGNHARTKNRASETPATIFHKTTTISRRSFRNLHFNPKSQTGVVDAIP